MLFNGAAIFAEQQGRLQALRDRLTQPGFHQDAAALRSDWQRVVACFPVEVSPTPDLAEAFNVSRNSPDASQNRPRAVKKRTRRRELTRIARRTR